MGKAAWESFSKYEESPSSYPVFRHKNNTNRYQANAPTTSPKVAAIKNKIHANFPSGKPPKISQIPHAAQIPKLPKSAMVFNIINLIEIVIALNSPTFSPIQSTLRFVFFVYLYKFFRYTQKNSLGAARDAPSSREKIPY